MKELTNQDLKGITEASSAPMISIYLSRDHMTPDLRALTEKWRESLSKAEFFLLKDYTRSFVHTFMEPLKSTLFLETLEHLDKGVIVFYSTEHSGYLKVQSTINDLVVVADSFHIKPLLRIRNNERGFFLIAMSAKAINVSVETNGHLYRMESFKSPAIDMDVSNNKAKPDAKDFIAHAAAELNKTLALYKLPIILAGVKDHLGHMKKYLDHSMILEDCIVGNVERLKAEELREKCFELLEPYYRKKEQESIEELNLAVKKNQAITYIEDIAVSAVYGKIRKLFVVENRQLWGTIDKNNGEIFISPKQTNSHDDDILDDICQLVLSKGGEVIVLKDAENVKGYIAAAIVTDTSHLYDFNQPSYSVPG
ncbi:MAG: baeRF3 domain-containing protein [Bacteriovorax sp.]